MSPKTIDEAINNLKEFETQYSNWTFRKSGLFHKYVETHFIFLQHQVTVFLCQVYKANIDSLFFYSFDVDNVKRVSFKIFDTDRITELYSGQNDKDGCRLEISIDRTSYQYGNTYTNFSCGMLIEYLNVLQQWKLQFKKHLKADAKLKKESVTHHNCDEYDTPW